MKKDSKQTQLTPLETALQGQFKTDANSVRYALDSVEHSRQAFAADAVKFGLCAIAARAVVGRGNFGAWLSSALADKSGNPRPSAERTAYDYIGLAKVFVGKFGRAATLTGPLAEAVVAFCETDGIEVGAFDIGKVLADAKATDFLLKIAFAGMSIRAMRNLLREGAECADEDKKAEDTAAKTLTKQDLKGLSGNGGGQSPQMLLWDDWTNSLAEFDKLTKHKDIVRLPLEKLVLIEKSLEDRLDEIKNLIRHCGE